MIDEIRDGGSRLVESYRALQENQRGFNAEVERLLTKWTSLTPNEKEAYHANFFGMIEGVHPLLIEGALKIKNLPSEWRRELEAML